MFEGQEVVKRKNSNLWPCGHYCVYLICYERYFLITVEATENYLKAGSSQSFKFAPAQPKVSPTSLISI